MIITEIDNWQLTDARVEHAGCVNGLGNGFLTENRGVNIRCVVCHAVIPKHILVYFMMTDPNRFWQGIEL